MGINDCLLTDFAIKKQITAYEKIIQALTNSDKRHYQSAFYYRLVPLEKRVMLVSINSTSNHAAEL